MIRRGQVWRYDPVLQREGKTNLWLIVSANSVNDHEDLNAVLALEVFNEDPGGLLAVSLGNGWWVTALRIMPIVKSRFIEAETTVSDDIMDSVSRALRTVQDL